MVKLFLAAPPRETSLLQPQGLQKVCANFPLQAALPQMPSLTGGAARTRQGEGGHGEETILNHPCHFLPPSLEKKKTAGCLQLPTAPLGAVKINPAFPILKGNTDTNENKSLCGQRGVQQPWKGRGRQLVRPPNPYPA